MSCSPKVNTIKFLFSVILVFPLLVQSQDSLKLKGNEPRVVSYTSRHSPQKAALLSTFLPGAGQLYNRKYWKAPIVWAGMLGFTYLYLQQNSKYSEAKDAYLQLLDTTITVKTPYNGTINSDVVQATKNGFRSQRDMFLIFGILFYALNIADAAVDAHLFKFDVSDELSLKMNMDMINYAQAPQVPSLCFRLNLKNRKNP